jgi:hypothetical protein
MHFGNGFGELGGQVVRNQIEAGKPVTWRASINARELGLFESLEAAMAHVEREIRVALKSVIEDWNLYLSDRAKRATGRS